MEEMSQVQVKKSSKSAMVIAVIFALLFGISVAVVFFFSAQIKLLQTNNTALSQQITELKTKNEQAVSKLEEMNKQIDEETQVEEETEARIPEDYLGSSYRVVHIEQFETNDLIIATTRRPDDVQENDTTCGSIYTMPTCYFFIEPGYHVDELPRGYLGKLERKGAILPDSFKDLGNNLVEFKTGEGDGGWTRVTTWNLNLETGEFLEINTEESVGDY